jgi:hypothetical protein
MNLLCRKQETSDRTVEADEDDDAVDPSQDMSTAGVRKLKPWMRFTKLFVLCLIWIIFTVKTLTWLGKQPSTVRVAWKLNLTVLK